ncbi:prolipoprotein diacylglyceryl transferase [Corynebacterium lizhenjunii]|uniref:Phosphatidylglycerol--prolipoprotein diacylglyceryl transferase n=1 Tax=Corynebacterium lizhenjunii TaxID=2709394 RepID=A0A7T0KDV7_9CORY|nr:prolipoprotein diacylglyceryl transferase [Corynebacterium lizhenjunii]QPK78460.1 prolipoprotein diacylglyceryl transferase [Corynebacterium lizhenjunii]
MQIYHLANIPSPPQGVWHLGPVPIRAYALCIVVGIIFALWLTLRRYRAMGGNPDTVWDAAIVIIPAGIIGGRAYHVLTDYDKYFCAECHPVDVFKVSNGGLGIWGAVALGLLAMWVLFRIKGVPLGPFADAVAPGLVAAQAIGRLGNWFNQELYGRETTVPWALDIYYRVDEAGRFAPMTGRSTGEVVASVHPTFLYELLWNLAVCGFLLWAHKRWSLGHGRVFALYVVAYTAGRFVVENLRADEATMVFDMRINVLVAVVLCAVALVVFFRLPRGQESPAEVDPKFAARAGA